VRTAGIGLLAKLVQDLAALLVHKVVLVVVANVLLLLRLKDSLDVLLHAEDELGSRLGGNGLVNGVLLLVLGRGLGNRVELGNVVGLLEATSVQEAQACDVTAELSSATLPRFPSSNSL
jgi:hypothetical protein